jgi:hypothetical protein
MRLKREPDYPSLKIFWRGFLMNCRFASIAAMIAVVALASLPAAANSVQHATATDTCSGFSLTVSGNNLGSKTATVDFTITLTPSSGSPIEISDSFVVTRTPHGTTYNTTYTQTWAHYGVTLNGNYTLTGTASFAPHHYHPTGIVFSPSTLNCSVVTGSCQPSSSLGVLASGTNITTYVPNGAWATTFTGLSVVPVEGGGSSATISTPNVVNSCAANSTTGEVVCTSNANDVYLITGSTLNNTIPSDGNLEATFSGGSCITCGVAMNAASDFAVLTIGYTPGTLTTSSHTALDFLNLSTNKTKPVQMTYQVSEDVLWDQGRNLVLSPGEQGVYDIYNTSNGVEYGNIVGGELDSAAEECSTGIALASNEGSSDLFIADLTQATFTAGAPGTWTTTAEQFQNFPEFGNFSAGTSGISIAQGSHLGIVTGEFGGNWMGVIQLPATSGSGTPSVLDYAAVALPNTPDGNIFQQGLDPHTVTAYVSPNSNDAIGLMANGYLTPPTWLAVIDLTKLLAAPRTSGTHFVDPSYNLIANGVLTYVAVP